MFRKIRQLIRKLSGYPLKYRVVLVFEDHGRLVGLFDSKAKAEGWLSDNLQDMLVQPNGILIKGEY